MADFPWTRDELVQKLWARLALATGPDGDHSAVLEEEARVEAAQLVMVSALSGDAAVDDLEVGEVLGAFHWRRYQLQPGGEDDSDMGGVLIFYSRVYPRAPSKVPVELRSLIATHLSSMWFEEAQRSLSEPALIEDRQIPNLAVVLLQNAVNVTPRSHQDRARYLHSLSVAFHTRFDRLGDLADLDMGIIVGQRAFDAAADRPILRDISSDLGRLYLARLEATDNPRDLDAAIEVLGDAADKAGTGPGVVSRLALAYQLRFERYSMAADLESAMRLERQAIAIATDGGAAVSTSWSRLALRCLAQYFLSEMSTDLDAAFEAAAHAQATSTDNSPRAKALVTSSLVRYGKFVHTVHDLETRLAREVVGSPAPQITAIAGARESSESGAGGRAGPLSTRLRLSRTLDARYRASAGAPSAADLSATYDSELAACLYQPIREPLSNHSPAITVRRWLLDADELDQAIESARLAAEALSDNDPEYGLVLTHLANVLIARYRHFGAEVDTRAAVGGVLRRIVDTESATIDTRAMAALYLIQIAGSVKDWTESQVGWDRLVELVPLMFGDTVDSTRRRRLRLLGGAGTLAASVSVVVGDPRRAWSQLEYGRDAFLTLSLRSRGTLDKLKATRPDLAQSVQKYQMILEANNARRLLSCVDTYDDARDATRIRRRVLGDWGETAGQIRSLPGFSNFGIPSDPAVADEMNGTIVSIVLGEHESAALILQNRVVNRVELPSLSRSGAIVAANALISITHHPVASADVEISEILAWLWDVLVEPVFSYLRYEPVESSDPEALRVLPRVWWIPDGPLSLLPIHAAGSGAELPWAGSYAVASYTSTAGAVLGRAKTPLPAGGRSLLIGCPEPRGHARLDLANEEVEILSHLLPGELELVRGREATTRKVLDRLEGASLAHFACTVTHAFDPANSGFALSDGQLAAAETASVLATPPRIAFLSSCNAPVGSGDRLDEFVQMASVLQRIGVDHVVTALWPMAGELRCEFVRQFYTSMLADRPLHEAVHQASLVMRRTAPNRPSIWASFCHFGN